MANTFITVKKLFFDKTPITKEMDRKSIKTLAKFGAFSRKIAQQSMKTKKGHAPPGSPPYSHGNKYLKKFYFFVVDKKEKSVVVGPVLLSKYSDIRLPKVLEGGGRISKRLRSGKVKVSQIAARPYTAPATKKHLGSIAGWYKDA